MQEYEWSFCNPCGYTRAPRSLGVGESNRQDVRVEKDKERYYRLILHYFVFLDRELERKAAMKLSGEKMKSWGDGRRP